MSDASVEMFGRKIFFLNPAYSVKKDVISALQKEEYEVYVIENYKDAKNLMRANQGSVLFINIDAQLSVGAWFNFVRSFEKEPALCSIYVSIISERIKYSDAELFIKNARVSGGVIDFEQGLEGIEKRVREVLESTNAKGRRQYVRANVMNNKEASLFWNHGTKLHQLKLLDISSVGMAAKVPAYLANQIIAKNFLLQDVTMRLGVKQLLVEAVIFAAKPLKDGSTMWILLLHQSTSPSVKQEIKNYVFQTIQKDIMMTINNTKQDDIDYNSLTYYSLATKHKSTGSSLGKS